MMQAFPVDQLVKNSPAKQETLVQFLDWEDPLDKGMATHVFLPGEFHGQKSLEGYTVHGFEKNQTPLSN